MFSHRFTEQNTNQTSFSESSDVLTKKKVEGYLQLWRKYSLYILFLSSVSLLQMADENSNANSVVKAPRIAPQDLAGHMRAAGC